MQIPVFKGVSADLPPRRRRDASARAVSMPRLGLIGVGTMGEPMAANLLKAGYAVSVVDPNPEPVARLAAQGAKAAATPAALAAEVDVVLCSLPNDAIVESVLLGSEGVIAGGKSGLLVVDTSTISPLTAQHLATALEPRGISIVEAPVSGGQPGAIAGSLAIMVGGSREVYDRVLPILQAIGKNITYVGDHGSALVVKLCNNLITGAVMCAASEALTMAAKAGIDPGLVHSILSNSTARGWILTDYVGRTMLVGNTQPGFKLALQHKDEGLALEYGKQMGVPMFMTGLVHALFSQAKGMGKGDLDFSAVSQLYTEAVGVSVQKRETE